jgi:hypothetical protein
MYNQVGKELSASKGKLHCANFPCEEALTSYLKAVVLLHFPRRPYFEPPCGDAVPQGGLFTRVTSSPVISSWQAWLQVRDRRNAASETA